MDKIFLAIPSYRCADQIERVLSRLAAAEDVLTRIHAGAVIDNVSADATAEVAQRTCDVLGLSPRLKVYRNAANYGLGGTHKVAFELARQAGCSALAILHGDDQADPAELADLFAAFAHDASLDAALGARFLPGSRLRGYAPMRIAGNLALNVAYTGLTGRWTSDLGSGLNVFRLAAIEPEALQRCSDGFTFNMDLLLHLFARRRRIAYVPITWTEADQVSNARNFKVGRDALWTLLRWRFGLGARGPATAMAYASHPFRA